MSNSIYCVPNQDDLNAEKDQEIDARKQTKKAVAHILIFCLLIINI